MWSNIVIINVFVAVIYKTVPFFRLYFNSRFFGLLEVWFKSTSKKCIATSIYILIITLATSNSVQEKLSI